MGHDNYHPAHWGANRSNAAEGLRVEREGGIVKKACAGRRDLTWLDDAKAGAALQPEATGAVMEVTKWLKPSV
jgi:hypothetical protein